MRFISSLNTSKEPAVLLAREWHLAGIPFEFEHAALYREVALESGCYIVQVAKREDGGTEYFLFATRTPGLSDERYLACIPE